MNATPLTIGRRVAQTDCLIIGFNDGDFQEYVEMTKSMGTSSGAYRDLNLAFIEYGGKPQRSVDMLNHFYSLNKKGAHKPFHNADFLWPVVTVLGSYLAKNGFSFDYVNLFHLEKERLKRKLMSEDILTIAITTTLYVSPYPILEVLSFVRQYNKTAKIVLGGPYVSNQVKMADPDTVQELFNYIGADFYVNNSEGEFALANIIQVLKAGASPDNIDNIAYRRGEEYVITQSSIESNDLEENQVAYGLFSKEDFGEFVTLRTAKSCPFSCAFCGFPQRAGKYTYIGVDLVENELNAIANLGTVTTLTFIDDTFNVPKGRFKDILRMMIRNKYGFKWNSYLRSDHADEEAIELMARSGCEGVFLGVESGSDQMLQRMNKSSRRQDYMRVIPLLKQHGVSTHASFIVGFPGETFETNQETLDFIEEARPDFFRTQLWYCDPTTPIWQVKDQYGVKGSAFNWSHATMDVETACELIERAFLAVENSLWLPQNGFDQWSTFYLQRRGMTMDQIKTFVKCFNTIVKQKLIFPEKNETDHDLIESLKRSCQFDQPAEPDCRPLEAFSGSRYVAAEAFWVKDYSQGAPTFNLEALRDGAHLADTSRRGLFSTVIDRAMMNQQNFDSNRDACDLLLAGFSLLLSQLSGQQDTLIACALNRKNGLMTLPLRLRPLWNMTFKELVDDVRGEIARSSEHQLFAFHILSNPLMTAKFNCASPHFDVGYAFYDTQAAGGQSDLNDAFRMSSEASDRIALLLKAIELPEGISLELSYLTAWFKPETIEKLCSYFVSMIKEVCANPDVLLESVVVEQQTRALHQAVAADTAENFNFQNH